MSSAGRSRRPNVILHPCGPRRQYESDSKWRHPTFGRSSAAGWSAPSWNGRTENASRVAHSSRHWTSRPWMWAGNSSEPGQPDAYREVRKGRPDRVCKLVARSGKEVVEDDAHSQITRPVTLKTNRRQTVQLLRASKYTQNFHAVIKAAAEATQEAHRKPTRIDGEASATNRNLRNKVRGVKATVFEIESSEEDCAQLAVTNQVGTKRLRTRLKRRPPSSDDDLKIVAVRYARDPNLLGPADQRRVVRRRRLRRATRKVILTGRPHPPLHKTPVRHLGQTQQSRRLPIQRQVNAAVACELSERSRRQSRSRTPRRRSESLEEEEEIRREAMEAVLKSLGSKDSPTSPQKKKTSAGPVPARPSVLDHRNRGPCSPFDATPTAAKSPGTKPKTGPVGPAPARGTNQTSPKKPKTGEVGTLFDGSPTRVWIGPAETRRARTDLKGDVAKALATLKAARAKASDDSYSSSCSNASSSPVRTETRTTGVLPVTGAKPPTARPRN